jgi:hypothetical protein
MAALLSGLNDYTEGGLTAAIGANRKQAASHPDCR